MRTSSKPLLSSRTQPLKPIRGVRVFNPQGKEVPAQWEQGKAIFLASVPSVGYAVYGIVPSLTAAPAGSLKATSSSIENDRYRVSLDDHGDVVHYLR